MIGGKPFERDMLAHGVAQTAADVSVVLAPLSDAALGHKAQLVALGWSEQVAEVMAMQYYVLLLEMVKKGIC